MRKISEIIKELEKGGMGSGKKKRMNNHLVESGVKKEPVRTTDLAREMITRGTTNIFDTIRAKAAANKDKPSPLFRSETPTDDLVEKYSKSIPKPPKAGSLIRFKKDPETSKISTQISKDQLKEAGIDKIKKPKMGE